MINGSSLAGTAIKEGEASANPIELVSVVSLNHLTMPFFLFILTSQH